MVRGTEQKLEKYEEENREMWWNSVINVFFTLDLNMLTLFEQIFWQFFRFLPFLFCQNFLFFLHLSDSSSFFPNYTISYFQLGNFLFYFSLLSHKFSSFFFYNLPFYFILIFHIKYFFNIQIQVMSKSLSQKPQSKTSDKEDKNIKQYLEAIAVKFMLNLPSEEKNEPSRLAYHYKKAYYYLVDSEQSELFFGQEYKKIDFNNFCSMLNRIINKFLTPLQYRSIEKILRQHRPTCGAIIFNKKCQKVLVTVSHGRYGFPKGCSNEGETDESCAIREVYQQVGLYINEKVLMNSQKVSYKGRGEAPVTFFIIKDFDEKQKLSIQRVEIEKAIWISPLQVSKCIYQFNQKCRNAWREYERLNQSISPSLSIEQFLQTYRSKSAERKDRGESCLVNPLINFELDKQKLFSIFKFNEVQAQ